jgi:quinohemoprotein ethanol dehydrogenase
MRACFAILFVLLALRPPAAFAAEPAGDWPVTGHDQAGGYFSPLDGISAGNVDRLGFAWDFDLGGGRGQESTPIVVDGIMYASSIWGHAFALDARTGKQLWHYDPEVPGGAGRYACCDVVNRGLAYRNGRVFVASLDGRLHALDAATGKPAWVIDTIIDHAAPYGSTGGVVLTGDSVIIGNAGADLGKEGTRGYVSAYDIANGALKWRFFVVPPAPGLPLENPELALARKSWGPSAPDRTAERWGGGGSPWDGITYDPALDLVYVGTGNAAPYDQHQRSKDLHADDLYCASILAIHAGTGRLAWYYQETPGDHWDYDATQKMMLADLDIGGTTRPVIMQASKNGFFYVLDRTDGKLLGAEPFTFVNWAKRIDLKTGRPVVTRNADYSAKPKNIYPSWAGGHTWNPTSFDPRTGLVYIPSIDAPNLMFDLQKNGGSVKHLEGFFTVNGIIPDDGFVAADNKRIFGDLPDREYLKRQAKRPLVREILKAFDPKTGKVVWSRVTSEGLRGYDGGVLSTGGNLVFQGRGSGQLWVYAADTGDVLKVVETGSHIMAAPMTYQIDGVQYVAVQAGYGGAAFTAGPIPPSSAAFTHQNVNRIIVFKLDGGAVPPPPERPAEPFLKPPASTAGKAEIEHGEDKFVEQCSRCHVFGPSITPDLRKLPAEIHDSFKDIVLRGALSPMGMAAFGDVLSEADADAIHAYLIDMAAQGYEDQIRAKP